MDMLALASSTVVAVATTPAAARAATTKSSSTFFFDRKIQNPGRSVPRPVLNKALRGKPGTGYV